MKTTTIRLLDVEAARLLMVQQSNMCIETNGDCCSAKSARSVPMCQVAGCQGESLLLNRIPEEWRQVAVSLGEPMAALIGT